MNVLQLPIKEIKFNPKNPRKIEEGKLQKLVGSIKEAPWMLEIRPIVVDDNLMVLGGNMRLKACLEAGLQEVPVIKASELTEDQKREFIIKDNIGFGEWDFEELNLNWGKEELNDWGLDIPNFDDTSANENIGVDEINYTIILECASEFEQKKLYEELEKRGFKCKLMM